MSKIMLINSPLFRNKISGYSEDSLPPLGLGYIATELQKKEIDVNLIDSVSNNIPLDELISLIESEKPEFTGLNIFSTNFELVKEIVEKVKINTHFLIGGQITKSTYEKITNFNCNNNIDIIIGDGENITPDIILNNLKENPTYSINNKRVFNIDRNSIYFQKNICNTEINRSFFKNEPILNKFGYKEANIITSRGCIHNCAFCGAAKSINKEVPVRIKTEESIGKEVDYLIRYYSGLKSIRVLDDLFLRKVEDIEKANNIFGNKVYWRTMAHALSFYGADKKDFELLFKSGCNEVFIGIESGSKKTLKSINKPHDLDYMEKTIVNLLKAGVNVKGYFIYGFPGETMEDMSETYNFAHKLKKNNFLGNFNVSVFQFRPYHGTILYEKLINRDNLSFDRNTELNLDRRLQFNFQAGNFSEVSDEILGKYIKKTMDLNHK